MSSHKDPKPNQTVAAGNPLGDPPAPLGQPAGGEAKARTDEEHRSEPPPGVAKAAAQGHSSRSGSSAARLDELAAPATGKTVAELAAYVGGQVRGEAQRRILRCNGLLSARQADISFLSNAKYEKHLAVTEAGCVVVGRDWDVAKINRGGRGALTVIQTDDPYYSFQQIVVLLHGFRRQPPAGVSAQAVIADSARVAANAHIGPFVYVGENAVIGAGCVLHAHVTVLAGARLGEECILYPGATVYDDCVLGRRVILQAGAVIGSDGYGFATHQGVHHKIPQIGNVILEDDVEVGANTVIERAMMESTVIARGTKLGNAVVVGHNCRIGEHNLLVSQVGIAGSTSTGHHVVMAGQVGVAGHLRIGELVRIAAQSGIMADVAANQDIGGTPALEIKHARRVYFHLSQLPELVQRVRKLEEAVRRGDTGTR